MSIKELKNTLIEYGKARGISNFSKNELIKEIELIESRGGYYDTNEELTKNELIKKFKNEYGENIFKSDFNKLSRQHIINLFGKMEKMSYDF